ncbi:selenium-dependent molybdenum cofactor biosynthesis protein YqeB [Adlercreutzia sp. ZJ138]|uniref:selenium-dependent molybdenum cofactor biosynthesis protein YqeB n=1 Tax=Adlercreutzia sp. ZJ138 TaxID=2709405 RepID=UPI0013EA48EA|nr:selenium-dependent molybdenum cofactor biosynthesis protein YqeB [Adlercreutzia sp. ZJ138]
MIYGVLLAAGLSTRMGEDKMLLPIDGQCMVSCSLQKACAVCDRVVVVVRPQLAGMLELPDGVVELVNQYPEQGQGASIAHAIRHIQTTCSECESALFFLGDMPRIDIEVAREVCRRAVGHPEAIVIARKDGRICHPSAFGAAFFDELSQLEGDTGGRQIIQEHPDAVEYFEVPQVESVDVDTCCDYMAMLLGNRKLVVVRGAGDIASGSIYRLHQAGFLVVALDIEQPTVIRRTVSYAQALIDGVVEIEGVTAVKCTTLTQIAQALQNGQVPVLSDPKGNWIGKLKPAIVVDAILAKCNMGTTKDCASVVVCLGPGFTAGVDCHAVVETKRGHTLGHVIYNGSAIPNTGVPGNIGGYASERVVYSSASGRIKLIHDIGDHVEAGEEIAHVGTTPILAPIPGMLRGMIADESEVWEGLKIADVDPRDVRDYCFSISDKAKSVAGGVLEAVMHLMQVKM